MNKSIFLLLALICFSCLSYTQSTIGIKSGYTDAWPDYGDAVIPENAETHVSGFNVSFLYERPIINGLSIAVLPGFVQRGAACFPGWQPIFIGDTKVKMNYVEMPLMVNYDFAIFDKFCVTPSLGYGASYLISAMQEITPLDPAIAPTRSRVELKDNRLKRLDHGAYGSLCVKYKTTNSSSLFFETSYYHAISNYDKWETALNRSLSYSIGYSVKI